MSNNWTKEYPKTDGVYLSAFDEWDEDEDAEIFHFKNGKLYKDGSEWFSSGGVWKRIGDLPV